MNYFQRAVPEDRAMSRYLGDLLEGLAAAFHRLPPTDRARLEAILLQNATMQQLDASRANSLLCTALGESTENRG